MRTLDINVSSPDQLAKVLRDAAQAYAESSFDLASTWQDENAGRIWRELAKILDTAANRADTAVDKFFK